MTKEEALEAMNVLLNMAHEEVEIFADCCGTDTEEYIEAKSKEEVAIALQHFIENL